MWNEGRSDAVVAAHLGGIARGYRFGVPVRNAAGRRHGTTRTASGLRDRRRAGGPALRRRGGPNPGAGPSDAALWLLAWAQPAMARHAFGSAHDADRIGQADRRLGLSRRCATPV